MYVEAIPNRNSPPAILVRRSRREGEKVVKTTLANITDWPEEAIDALRRALRGERLVPVGQILAIEDSRSHGHVELVLAAMRRLGLDRLVCARPCRERDLVLALIVQRLVAPASKLATTRSWHTTTLAEELGVADADEDELYAALDWLLVRQDRIEKALAQRHLQEGGRALYDVSSSSYHGRCCPLAQYGHNRDGDTLKSIAYGLLATPEGCPVAVAVYPGHTGDPTTLPDQVQTLRERFGLQRVVLVGDRGTITQTQVETLRTYPGLGWVGALKSQAIRALVEQGALQLSLFDAQHLAEIASPAYPGERLVACYNPLLAQDRARTREELLQATEAQLAAIQAEVMRRTKTPLPAQAIGVKVGKALARTKMAQHFVLEIADHHFVFARNADSIAREAQLDGIYVVRTSEAQADLSAADTVRAYKDLQQVEQAFRCLKRLDLRIRPIHHRTEAHVKAHVFVCMLAYYVEWHLRRVLAPVLFMDEELPQARRTRDPVEKAVPSASVNAKKRTKKTPEGWPVHSLQTLLETMGTRCKNTCRFGEGRKARRLALVTEATPFQQHVLDLVQTVVPGGACTQ